MSSLKTHGMRYTRFYSIYYSMKDRCLNKNYHYFNHYGGIKICERWLESFENFKDDMYESYLEHSKLFTEKNTTIDRIDVNGDYCLENCKWATRKEQSNNRGILKSQRTFKAINPEGKEFISNNMSIFAKEQGLNREYIRSRIKVNKEYEKGWNFKYI